MHPIDAYWMDHPNDTSRYLDFNTNVRSACPIRIRYLCLVSKNREEKRHTLVVLRQHEQPDLEKAFYILKDFTVFLADDNAKTADLDRLTERMNKVISVTLPPRTPLKLTLSSLREYRYFNDILGCVASIIVGAVIGIVGKYAFNVTNGYSYPLAVTVALGVAVIYFAYLRKVLK